MSKERHKIYLKKSIENHLTRITKLQQKLQMEEQKLLILIREKNK